MQMERQATVAVNFKLGDLRSQVQTAVSSLRGSLNSTGLGDRLGEAMLNAERITLINDVKQAREEQRVAKEQAQKSAVYEHQINTRMFGNPYAEKNSTTTGLANDRKLREQSEATKGLKDTVRDLAQVAAGTGLAMTGFVAAASPNAINTLWGSVKLLSMEMGVMLLPAVVNVSGALQTAADWVRGLDGSTKGVIATFATWAGGLAVGSYALLKVMSVGATVIETMGKLKDVTSMAVTGIARFATVHPVITGLAVTVGILTNGFGLLGERVNYSVERLQSLRDIQRKSGREALSSRDYELAVPESIRNRIESAAPAARSGVLDEEIQRADRAAREAQASEQARSDLRERFRVLDEESSNPLSRGQSRYRAAREVLTRHFGEAEADRRLGEMADQSLLRNRSGISGLDSSYSGPRFAWDQDQRNAAAERLAGTAGQAVNGALASALRSVKSFGLPNERKAGPMLSDTFQSREFGSGGDFYGSIVRQTLSGSELNKEIERRLDENNQILRDIRDEARDRAWPI